MTPSTDVEAIVIANPPKADEESRFAPPSNIEIRECGANVVGEPSLIASAPAEPRNDAVTEAIVIANPPMADEAIKIAHPPHCEPPLGGEALVVAKMNPAPPMSLALLSQDCK